MSDKSWAEIAQFEASRRAGGSINNLRLESGKEYTIRFVGDPIRFYKYFVAGKSAITEFNDENCVIRRKYNIDPTTRYAVHVIDRADPSKLKIVELAPSILKPVINWWKRRNTEPGGDKGCDFGITVTGQKKNTRYEVIALDVTPFTPEEMAIIEKEVGSVANAIDRLKKLYKPTPQDEIEMKLFPPEQQQTAPAGVTAGRPQPVAAQSAQSASWTEPPF